VTNAFRQAALIYHPDKRHHAADTYVGRLHRLKTRLFNESDEERFLRIRNAYDALSGASREAKSKSI